MRRVLFLFLVLVVFGALLVAEPDEEQSEQKSGDVKIAEKASNCAVAIYATHVLTTGKERVISSHHVTVSFSGFFYDSGGHIVTVAQPVEGAKQILVQTNDRKQLKAEVVGISSRDNIALLKVNLEGSFVEPLELLEKSPPVGSRIMVVSSPLGLKNTVVFGNISGSGRTLISKGRIYTDMLQLSVPSSQSDPGGLVTDEKGRIIGMVAPAYIKPPVVARTEELLRNIAGKLSELQGTLESLIKDEKVLHKLRELQKEARKLLFPEKLLEPLLGSPGITFAIPLKSLKKSVDMLLRKKDLAWLGVGVRPLTEKERTHIKKQGLLVVEVVEGGPSERAGIKEMDILLLLNDRQLTSLATLKSILTTLEPGRDVKLVVYRRGEKKELTVTLGSVKQKRSFMQRQPR